MQPPHLRMGRLQYTTFLFLEYKLLKKAGKAIPSNNPYPYTHPYFQLLSGQKKSWPSTLTIHLFMGHGDEIEWCPLEHWSRLLLLFSWKLQSNSWQLGAIYQGANDLPNYLHHLRQSMVEICSTHSFHWILHPEIAVLLDHLNSFGICWPRCVTRTLPS